MRDTPRPRSFRSSVLVAVGAVTLTVFAAPATQAQDDPVPAGETVVGELVQGYADPGPHDEHAGEPEDAGLLSWVQTAPGETVRVPTEDLGNAPAGATVQVTVGEAVVDEASQAGLEPAHEVLAAEVLTRPEQPVAAVSGPVNHPVTVVMLQPAGTPLDGTTLAEVVDAVNGPVADFWEEQTDGAVRFGTVAGFDWPAEPSALDCADPFALWREAATRAGWTAGPDKHLLVYVPDGSSGCSYGLGTVGTGSVGSGGLTYVRATATSLIAHELGHNLGLGHASHLQCAGVVDDRSTCYIRSYYDMYDVMGLSWGEIGSLNAPHAARLGVLTADAAPTVLAGAATAQFSLAPVGARTGTRAVRLVDSDGDEYWLEYRTAIGRDAFLGTAANWHGLETGVLLRRTGGRDGDNTSFLLDGTPKEQAWWPSDLAVALPRGRSTSFGTAPFRVTVLEVTGSAATVQVVADHPINIAYEAAGGPRGVLGEATAAQRCGLPSGGCQRTYAGGSIYWSPATGARIVRGAIGTRWTALGAEGGWLGYPTGEAACGLKDGGCYQVFQGGGLYWSAATGARAVSGFLWGRWASLGYEGGWLGYPTGDVLCGLKNGGCYQTYQGGALYWSAATGARAVSGFLWGRWASLGYEGGWLGYPASDVRCGLEDGGCYQLYQRGALYWSSATGARAVSGFLWDRWAAMGYERGRLGYPTSDVTCGLRNGGCYQIYQGGGVYWSGATGAWIVNGELWGRWAAQGYEAGPLGYPLSDVTCVPSRPGCYQRFQGGTIHN